MVTTEASPCTPKPGHFVNKTPASRTLTTQSTGSALRRRDRHFRRRALYRAGAVLSISLRDSDLMVPCNPQTANTPFPIKESGKASRRRGAPLRARAERRCNPSRRPASVRTRNKALPCLCESVRNCACFRFWTRARHVCASARPSRMRRAVRRQYRTAGPLTFRSTDLRRSLDNNTSRDGCLSLAFARYRQPPHCPSARRVAIAPRRATTARQSAQLTEAQKKDRSNQDAGGVSRPRIRATTVNARARSSTSIISLYHKRQYRQVRTEKIALRFIRLRQRSPQKRQFVVFDCLSPAFSEGFDNAA